MWGPSRDRFPFWGCGLDRLGYSPDRLWQLHGLGAWLRWGRLWGWGLRQRLRLSELPDIVGWSDRPPPPGRRGRGLRGLSFVQIPQIFLQISFVFFYFRILRALRDLLDFRRSRTHALRMGPWRGDNQHKYCRQQADRFKHDTSIRQVQVPCLYVIT